ncbi:methylated-DNA--protein-cysteine methyltransferase [Halogeometricum borinquense DSM 11551]|uniref:Methylated-DNA--protein-cysteine methyltransferase n=2 Tax=Halogeometricum borinquense TaxID=60847 RepID=E4NMQ8_HALBP|nr:methylated-DNA--[protein]-cysteine S-methyltransferase [Halogeometricum borinquense]ADQ66213.1 O-6-methylguanine DNA methyltransferase [Halogeometricum borinquense DSM 11551]ELY27292.1 methylated-DNA--protein-cysteine methyltransferase [Halogeometricum borinquense DSM 11551]RYJ14754.1 methylated-DNA--[protein]-cysteine S-methyltransferase [Halogeometricum borinquense]
MQVTVFDIDVELDESITDSEPTSIRNQIAAYERGERSTFDVDIRFPEGLTGAVMRCMRQIPYGETRTYGEIATELQTAPVAVGQACGRNPVPILVPCHRIVGTESLGGFSAGGEHGETLKHRLLALERADAVTDGVQATLDDITTARNQAQPEK